MSIILGDFQESLYLVRWAKLIYKYFVKLKLRRFAHPTFTQLLISDRKIEKKLGIVKFVSRISNCTETYAKAETLSP